MTATNDNRLTVDEAAAVLDVHAVTVRRMMAAGTLPAVRDGDRVFVPVSAVEACKGRVCGHCGQTYTPTRYATRGKYCSTVCQKAAAYERWKAAHPAERGPGRPPKDHAAPGAPVPERLQAALDHVRKTPKVV